MKAKYGERDRPGFTRQGSRAGVEGGHREMGIPRGSRGDPERIQRGSREDPEGIREDPEGIPRGSRGDPERGP
eukprot:1196419-Prorocentrum_minimum.AAC.2